jgi:hypothetical protein
MSNGFQRDKSRLGNRLQRFGRPRGHCKLCARRMAPSLAGRESNSHRSKRRAHRVERRESQVYFAMTLPYQKQAQGGNIGDYKEGHQENTQKG